VGSEVAGTKVGDRVVVNPRAAPSCIIYCGGMRGGMREFLLIEDAVVGRSVAVVPDTVPFDVAAPAEPMATDSATEDVTARLTELHGPAANALGSPAPAPTSTTQPAAPAVFNATIASAKWGARIGHGRRPDVVRQHRPRRYAPQRAHPHRLPGLPYGDLRGHPRDRGAPGPLRQAHQPPRPPFFEVERAFDLALTPGAAEKVIFTFDDQP
jgi:hypothetical protein